MTTATATTAPKITDLIGRMRTSNRAARVHAFWRYFLPNDDLEVTTSRHRSSKSFIPLCFENYSCQASESAVHFAYFLQRDQLEIIARHLT